MNIFLRTRCAALLSCLAAITPERGRSKSRHVRRVRSDAIKSATGNGAEEIADEVLLGHEDVRDLVIDHGEGGAGKEIRIGAVVVRHQRPEAPRRVHRCDEADRDAGMMGS